MRWQGRAGSSNVEDRRGRGFAGRMPLRGKPSAFLLVVVLVAAYYGVDLTGLLQGGGMPLPQVSQSFAPSQQEEELARFVSVALKTTEDTWEALFRQSGKTYAPPKLVLYSGMTETACGYGQAATGPFYCPADKSLYIDLAFYQDMQRKLGGGGDFALGYVLAHEVGHHVQNELGIAAEVLRLQRSASTSEANRLSVMLELQADCFAGVWGHIMQQEGILEAGDVQEALNTAAAIGDDRLQRQATGHVVLDSFTHGSSRQRLSWFRQGFDSGNPAQCNTFDGL